MKLRSYEQVSQENKLLLFLEINTKAKGGKQSLIFCHIIFIHHLSNSLYWIYFFTYYANFYLN